MQPLCADTCGQIHKASFSSSSKDLLLVTDKKKRFSYAFALKILVNLRVIHKHLSPQESCKGERL